MRNKLTDLNNHLFMCLERINTEGIKTEQLALEVDRGKAVSALARDIISNARLVLDAQIAYGERLIEQVPALLDSDAPTLDKKRLTVHIRP
jgi:hypothetical protein